MPDEELNEQGPEAGEGEEAPSSKRKWIIISAAAVLFLAVVAAGVWASGLLDPSEVEAESSPTASTKAPPPDVTEVVSLDPVVVNLLGTGKMSYARIAIALGIHNAAPGSEVFRREVMVPKIKDELLSTVGQMTSADLLRAETKEQLKSQIRKFVNGLLHKDEGEVVEVYFTDFIVQ